MSCQNLVALEWCTEGVNVGGRNFSKHFFLRNLLIFLTTSINDCIQRNPVSIRRGKQSLNHNHNLNLKSFTSKYQTKSFGYGKPIKFLKLIFTKNIKKKPDNETLTILLLTCNLWIISKTKRSSPTWPIK